MDQGEAMADHRSVPFEDVSHPDRYLRSFYDNAELYSIVAKQNHTPALVWSALLYCQGLGLDPPQRGIELCCGTGLLSVDLVHQGLRMTAVDTSLEMLRVARRNAEESGTEFELIEGNMITYRSAEPVDLVFNYGYNCSYILSNEEMLDHLEAVADSLRPGGVYLVDMEFLAHKCLLEIQRFEPPWIVYKVRPAHVAHGSKGGLDITIQFGDHVALYDPIRQLFRSKNSIRLQEGSRIEVIENESLGKLYHPLEFKALVAQSRRFEFVRWFEDHRLRIPFDGRPESEGYVSVLKRI